MHGRNNGKKLKAVTIVKHAMEIIHLLTDQNPIQVIVDAVVNRSVIKCIVLFLIDWSLLVISGRLVFIVLLTDQNPIQVIVDAVVNRSVIKYIVLFLIDWSLLVISGRLVFIVFLS